MGYNVQTAVDAEHHLIVADEVSNVGSDRGQLSNMAQRSREATGVEALTVVADRGYFDGEVFGHARRTGSRPSFPSR